jgi:hypothetical protein
MRQFGPSALFVQASLVHAIMATFALWRLLADPDKPRAPAAATP